MPCRPPFGLGATGRFGIPSRPFVNFKSFGAAAEAGNSYLLMDGSEILQLIWKTENLPFFKGGFIDDWWLALGFFEASTVGVAYFLGDL